MKVEQKISLGRNEMNMIRWMYGFVLKERKTNTTLRELLALEPVSWCFRRAV